MATLPSAHITNTASFCASSGYRHGAGTQTESPVSAKTSRPPADGAACAVSRVSDDMTQRGSDRLCTVIHNLEEFADEKNAQKVLTKLLEITDADKSKQRQERLKAYGKLVQSGAKHKGDVLSKDYREFAKQCVNHTDLTRDHYLESSAPCFIARLNMSKDSLIKQATDMVRARVNEAEIFSEAGLNDMSQSECCTAHDREISCAWNLLDRVIKGMDSPCRKCKAFTERWGTSISCSRGRSRDRIRYRSHVSPPRRRSPSPRRRRSPSPVAARGRSPYPIAARWRSPSPRRRRSPSPVAARGRSLYPVAARGRSPSPRRRRSPSPRCRRSPSPVAARGRSLYPVAARRRSRSRSIDRRR
jgi:hypothetical protein